MLAVLCDELGKVVEPLLDGAAVSTVSWSEILARYVDLGLDTTGREDEIESLGVSLAPVTRPASRGGSGSPVRDPQPRALARRRACLALALDLGGQPVTADQAWGRIDVGMTVTLIR